MVNYEEILSILLLIYSDLVKPCSSKPCSSMLRTPVLREQVMKALSCIFPSV